MEEDWLFEIGVDTTKVTSGLDSMISHVETVMDKMRTVQVSVDTSKAERAIEKLDQAAMSKDERQKRRDDLRLARIREFNVEEIRYLEELDAREAAITYRDLRRIEQRDSVRLAGITATRQMEERADKDRLRIAERIAKTTEDQSRAKQKQINEAKRLDDAYAENRIANDAAIAAAEERNAARSASRYARTNSGAIVVESSPGASRNVDSLRARFSDRNIDSDSNESVGSPGSTANRLALLDHETKMQRQSLSAQRDELLKWKQVKDATATEIMRVERSLGAVESELVKQTIAENKSLVESGRMTAEEHIASLRSIASETEYTARARMTASQSVNQFEVEQEARSTQEMLALAKEKANGIRDSYRMGQMSREEEGQSLRSLLAENQQYAEARIMLERKITENTVAQTRERISAEKREATATNSQHKSIGKEVGGGLINAGYMLPGLLGQIFMTLGYTGGSPVGMALGVGLVGAAAAGAGVAASAKEADQLKKLSIAVENSGQSFSAAKNNIEAWASLQEKTTAFGREQTIPGLQGLVDGGMKLADAMKVVRVAEDLSQGSGKTLEVSLQGLRGQYEGNTRSLISMGLATKDQIKDNMEFPEVLARIEKLYRGQAMATGELSIETDKFGHAAKHLAADIGSSLLPGATSAAEAMTKFMESMDGKAMGQGIVRAAQDIRDLVSAFEPLEPLLKNICIYFAKYAEIQIKVDTFAIKTAVKGIVNLTRPTMGNSGEYVTDGSDGNVNTKPNSITDGPVGDYYINPSGVKFTRAEVSGGSEYQSIVKQHAAAQQVDPRLVEAFLGHESNWESHAVSKAGALGLGQLLPGTASDMGVMDSFNPDQNIMGASKYIAQMMKRYHNNVPMAIAAYHDGPGAVDSYHGNMNLVSDEGKGEVKDVYKRYLFLRGAPMAEVNPADTNVKGANSPSGKTSDAVMEAFLKGKHEYEVGIGLGLASAKDAWISKLEQLKEQLASTISDSKTSKAKRDVAYVEYTRINQAEEAAIRAGKSHDPSAQQNAATETAYNTKIDDGRDVADRTREAASMRNIKTIEAGAKSTGLTVDVMKKLNAEYARLLRYYAQEDAHIKTKIEHDKQAVQGANERLLKDKPNSKQRNDDLRQLASGTESLEKDQAYGDSLASRISAASQGYQTAKDKSDKQRLKADTEAGNTYVGAPLDVGSYTDEKDAFGKSMIQSETIKASDISGRLAAFKNQVSNTTDPAAQKAIIAHVMEMLRLADERVIQEYNEAKKSNNKPLMEMYAKEHTSINDSAYGFKTKDESATTKIKTAADKAEALSKSVADLEGNALEKTASTIASLSNIATKTNMDDTAKQIAMYNEIRKEQEDINKLRIDDKLTSAETAQIDNAQRLLNIKSQMIPQLIKEQEILRANAEIEKSVMFKATESGIGKTLNKFSDKGIDKVLGLNKAGGGNEISQLFGDVIKAQTGEQNRNLAKSMTDRIFGIKTLDPNKKVAEDFGKIQSSLLENAKNNVTSSSTMVSAAEKIERAANILVGGKGSDISSAIAPDGTLMTSPSNGSINSMKYDTASGAISSVFSLISAAKSKDVGIGGLSSLGLDSVMTATTAFHNSAGNIVVAGSASAPGGKKMTRAEINQASLGRVTSGISGISSAISGYEQGGISGGLQTGMGISSLISAIAPHFGPAGIAISVVAGLVSALSHHDDPAKMADKYNTVPYGQGLADLTGKSAGANGTTFTTSASVYDQTNGKGQLGYIEQILSKGKPGYMSQAQYDSLVKEFGISATGAGSVEHGKNIGQERITGASGTDGQFRSYTQLNADATSALAQIQSKIGQTLAPIISMNAYGAGPGYKGNPNNMIGLSAQEMALTTKARLYGINSSQQGNSIVDPQYQQSPYATPGVGGQAPGSNASNPVYTAPANGNQMIKLTTNLVVSGQVLATIVNAVNAQTANKNGTAPA